MYMENMRDARNRDVNGPKNNKLRLWTERYIIFITHAVN